MPALELTDHDRVELLHELAELIAIRGHERFVAWPIVQPAAAFLPDRWEPTLAGVAILLRRLMLYANVDLPAELVAFNRESSEHHPDAPAWFAGIENGVCRFGIDIHEISDPQRLIACLCHEIAHAYRALHLLEDEDRQVEERLTDLTTVYLGFGVFAANGAEQYRKSGGYGFTQWSSSSLGYLDAETLCFLLAAQLVTRRENHREYVRHLEPNQAGYVRSYCELLTECRDDLLERLTLPPEAGWSAKIERTRFTGALSEDAVDVRIEEDASLQKSAPLSNEGRPVFRVRDSSARTAILCYVGGTAGAVAGLIASMITDSYSFVAVGLVLGIVFALTFGRNAPDYCSGPGCHKRLAAGDNTCPSCGGTIRGRIDSFSDHLEAEEALETQ
jgi:hypothetical protein